MITIITNKDHKVSSLFSDISLPISLSHLPSFKFSYKGVEKEVRVIEEAVEWVSNENDIDKNIFENKKNSSFLNPPENSIIFFNRWSVESILRIPFDKYGISYIKKLESIYKERNCKVLFDFAYIEPMDYELNTFPIIYYDYSFEHLKITDYKLFENQKNTIYNPFFNVWNFIYDLMPFFPQFCDVENPTYNQWLNSIVNNVDYREKVFSCLIGKPRYHRMHFLNEVIKKGLHDKGYITINNFFLNEYRNLILNGINTPTEHPAIDKEDLYNYFNLENLKDFSFYKNYGVKYPLVGDKRYNYMLENVKNEEHNNSYIEVVGETHCIFNKLYPSWSEKSYWPIYFKKFFIIAGANEFYKQFENIGGYTFIEELGINPSFLKEENPIIQMNYAVEAIEKLSLSKVRDLYINNKEKLDSNHTTLLSYGEKILEPIRDFVFL